MFSVTSIYSHVMNTYFCHIYQKIFFYAPISRNTLTLKTVTWISNTGLLRPNQISRSTYSNHCMNGTIYLDFLQ